MINDVRYAGWFINQRLKIENSDPCGSQPHKGHLISEMIPVLSSLGPSLIYPCHLLPSPVQPTRFSFCSFSGFLAIFIMLSSNNNNETLHNIYQFLTQHIIAWNINVQVSHQKDILSWTYIFGNKSSDVIVKFDCVLVWWPINCYEKNRKIRGNGKFYCTCLKWSFNTREF